MKPKRFDPSLRLLSMPLIIIGFAVLLAYILISSAIPKTKAELNKIKEAKIRLSILEQRIAVLKEFRAGVIADKTDTVYTVFPDKNPASINLSQIKSLASEDEIIIKSVKFELESNFDSAIKESNVTYELEAKDLSTLVRFLLKLDSIAPITRIHNLEVLNSGLEESKVNAKLIESVYWSALPTGLPPLTEPINQLTNEEIVLINKIYSFRLPQYSILQPEIQAEERLNPFN